MNPEKSLLAFMTAVILTAFALVGEAQTGNPPLSLIPMYGYPDIEKPAALKKADEDFIKAVVGERSREEVSKDFAGEGWRLLRIGDAANAMRRFNQSWLLNPNYYQPYWGFGAILFAQRKAAEAAAHYARALSLIDAEGEKPRLLSDAGRAYSMQGFIAAEKTKSEESFARANSLFKEAMDLDPHYANAYRYWAMSLYLEGNYERAWAIVRKSRDLGDHVMPSDFVDALSRKMPEPM